VQQQRATRAEPSPLSPCDELARRGGLSCTVPATTHSGRHVSLGCRSGLAQGERAPVQSLGSLASNASSRIPHHASDMSDAARLLACPGDRGRYRGRRNVVLRLPMNDTTVADGTAVSRYW
jgi:hypothetical protein